VFILSCTAVFAIDSEYKNSLVKIELNKLNDDSYNINLYSSKQFLTSPKVIKKSDLNYYILLPETKNNIQTTQSNNDIKNLSTNSYKYANTNNNGYTKIDITTSKPINFVVNVKVNQVASNNQTLALNDTIKKEKTEEANIVQKKNSDFSKNKSSETSEQKQIVKNKNIIQDNPKIKDKVQSKTVLQDKFAQNLPKAAAKINIQEDSKNKQTATKIQNNVSKKENPIKKEIKKQEKQSSDKNIKEIKKEVEKQIEKPKTQTVQNVELEKAEEKPLEQDLNIAEGEKNVSESEEINQTEEETVLQEELQKETATEVVNKKTVKQKLYSFINKIELKLNEYGLNLKDVVSMTIVLLALLFVVMLIILTRKNDFQTRLKSKADLIEKINKNETGFVPKKEPEVKPDEKNQYFIFDSNVRQTGLLDPATTEKRNYELSSYEPKLKEDYHRTYVEPYIGGKEDNEIKTEYDIIQKILKDDSFIEIAPSEVYVEEKEEKITPKQPTKPMSTPIKSQEPKISNEPEILSSVEIAPQRGFMCVSYNNNINLMGYIFDDVFALYDFNQPKLENYNIKFRLSEKTQNGANFIVKVGDAKMLISVTKSSMGLEIAM